MQTAIRSATLTPGEAGSNSSISAWSLAQVAEVLLDGSRRRDFQASPEAIEAAAAVLFDPVSQAVEIHAAQRAQVRAHDVADITREMLPGLMRSYEVSFGEPIAHLVIMISVECVARTRDALGRFLTRFNSIRKERPQNVPDAPAIVDETEIDLGEDINLGSDIGVGDDLSVESLSALDLPGLVPQSPAGPGLGEAMELEHELRLEEYVRETLAVLFEDLDEDIRSTAELYYLHGMEPADIGLIIGKTRQVVSDTVAQLGSYFAKRHQDPQLVSYGNLERRGIDRIDLKLDETHGVTLLGHLLRNYPRLRTTADLLNLVADSPKFFSDFEASLSPEIADFRNRVIGRHGIDLTLLAQPVRAMLGDLVRLSYPHPENLRYVSPLARLLGMPAKDQYGKDFVSRDANFLARCIEAKIYGPQVHKHSTLVVQRGSAEATRSIRNPLTLVSVVGPDLAQTNASILLRRTFPNLDVVHAKTPDFFVAKSILGLSTGASVDRVRGELVKQRILSGKLPQNFYPKTAASAYFNPDVVPNELEANRNEMIKRRWANIDDPEVDKYMALILGVPNTVEALVKRAAKTLGTDIPDKHPFKYNGRTDSHYFDPDIVGSETAIRNLKTALQDTFGNLAGFTYDRAFSEAGIPRLSRLLGVEGEGFRRIRLKIAELGYLT